eukprot:820073-Amphidinium_carterae.1
MQRPMIWHQALGRLAHWCAFSNPGSASAFATRASDKAVASIHLPDRSRIQGPSLLSLAVKVADDVLKEKTLE